MNWLAYGTGVLTFIAGLIIGMVLIIDGESVRQEFCGTNSALMLSNYQTGFQQCVWFEDVSNNYARIYSREYECDKDGCSFLPNTTKLYQGTLRRDINAG